MRAHLSFQKPIECPPFSKVAKEFRYIHPTNRKRTQKVSERIQPIEKRKQAAYALTFFENSNEIKKLVARVPA